MDFRVDNCFGVLKAAYLFVANLSSGVLKARKSIGASIGALHGLSGIQASSIRR